LRLYPFNINPVIEKFFSNLIWSVSSAKEKEIFLTFDDGPNEIATPYVLGLLAKFQYKATFFVVGANAAKHPKLIAQILDEGHSLGNHTYSHISGYKYNVENYIKDINLCQEITKTNLFRPPYGRILTPQINQLKENFKIIMWNQLSGDFDSKLDVAASLHSLKFNIKAGNIIVFHDSIKALENLKKILPLYFEHLAAHHYLPIAMPYQSYVLGE